MSHVGFPGLWLKCSELIKRIDTWDDHQTNHLLIPAVIYKCRMEDGSTPIVSFPLLAPNPKGKPSPRLRSSRGLVCRAPLRSCPAPQSCFGVSHPQNFIHWTLVGIDKNIDMFTKPHPRAFGPLFGLRPPKGRSYLHWPKEAKLFFATMVQTPKVRFQPLSWTLISPAIPPAGQKDIRFMAFALWVSL